jgi:hypothetical protein
MNLVVLPYIRKHRIFEKAKYGRIYMIYMKYKITIAAFPLLLLGVAGVTSQAFAWDWNDGGGGGDYWGHGGGYENRFLQNFYPQPGPGAYSNGYSAGISDAVYDHDNGLVYNPVGNAYHVILRFTGMDFTRVMIHNGIVIRSKLKIQTNV